MTSERQTRANRENAKKSTGPRTAEGKRKSSQNATTHGLLSSADVVLDGEDAELFEELRAGARAAHDPVGIWEELRVDFLAGDAWRALRATRMVTGAQAVLRAEQRESTRVTPRIPSPLQKVMLRTQGIDPDAPAPAPAATELEMEQWPHRSLARLFRDDAEGGALLERAERYETRLRRRMTETELALEHLQDRRLKKKG